jgi:hypothetical protein
MEPTPMRRSSSGGLSSIPLDGFEEESPRRRLFASASKEVQHRRVVDIDARTTPTTTTTNPATPFPPAAVASTPPLAPSMTPTANFPHSSPQAAAAASAAAALCCGVGVSGVSPRALFGGGKRRGSAASTTTMSTRELVLPAVEHGHGSDADDEGEAMDESDECDDDDDECADDADERANNSAMGLVAATHAVSFERERERREIGFHRCRGGKKKKKKRDEDLFFTDDATRERNPTPKKTRRVPLAAHGFLPLTIVRSN